MKPNYKLTPWTAAKQNTVSWSFYLPKKAPCPKSSSHTAKTFQSWQPTFVCIIFHWGQKLWALTFQTSCWKCHRYHSQLHLLFFNLHLVPDLCQVFHLLFTKGSLLIWFYTKTDRVRPRSFVLRNSLCEHLQNSDKFFFPGLGFCFFVLFSSSTNLPKASTSCLCSRRICWHNHDKKFMPSLPKQQRPEPKASRREQQQHYFTAQISEGHSVEPLFSVLVLQAGQATTSFKLHFIDPGKLRWCSVSVLQPARWPACLLA